MYKLVSVFDLTVKLIFNSLILAHDLELLSTKKHSNIRFRQHNRKLWKNPSYGHLIQAPMGPLFKIVSHEQDPTKDGVHLKEI